MNKLTSAALFAAVLGAATAVSADESAPPAKGPKEKCWGVSKVGENACASANGSHGCGGKATIDYDGQEFKIVPKGTCEAMNGSLKPFEGVNPKIKG